MPATPPQRSPVPLAGLPLLIAALTCAAGPAAAQVVEPRTPVESLQVGGRVHLQLNTTSDGGDVPDSEFLVRRARVWVGARINEWIDGVAQVDFSRGKASARYAFVRFSIADELRLSFGQFKRAFDLFELTSSSQVLVVERDGAIRGLAGCGGLGQVCSYSAFTEALELASLDVGMAAEGDLAGGRMAYSVTLTNGAGGNTLEDNDGKSVSGRLAGHPSPGVTLGANLAFHDYDAPGGDVAYAPAAALDVEWGNFAGGWHLQAGVLTGENWRNLDAAGEPSTFRAAQVIGSHRFPRDPSARIRGVEPMLRMSLGDPDTGSGSDGGVLVTPGLLLHFEGRNKVAANVDVWSPGDGPGAWSLKLQTYLYF